MTRKVPEWIGKNDDEAIPPRIKDQMLLAQGSCKICTREINEKLKPAFDHIIAICNGGPNRQSNLQVLCVPCHKVKTRADVAEKAMIARKRKKHLGIVTPRKKIASRGFAKSEPQRSASRPLRRSINDNAEG